MAQSPQASSPTAAQGPYTYYEPSRHPGGDRRSYAERTAERHDLDSLSTSSSVQENGHGLNASSGQHSPAVNGSRIASSSTARPHSPRYDDDSPPPNLRSKPWSPIPPSPVPQSAAPPLTTSTTVPIRRGSVPEKSHLQKLEAGLIIKEQKRAKVKQAEDIAQPTTQNGDHATYFVAQDGNHLERNSRVLTEIDPHLHSSTAQQDLQSSPTLPVSPVGKRKPVPVRTSDLNARNRGSYYVSGLSPALLSPTNSLPVDSSAAARGKAAHERRKLQALSHQAQLQFKPRVVSNPEPARPDIADEAQEHGDQEAPPAIPPQSKRRAISAQHKSFAQSDVATKDEPISKEEVKTTGDNPVEYAIPPQVASAQHARHKVGFSNEEALEAPPKHHHFGSLLHRHEHTAQPYRSKPEALAEWRTAGVARLKASDLVLTESTDSGSQYEEKAKQYRPQLFTKCGPLLRYTGIRKEASAANGHVAGGSEVEVWRGSIMVVTEDRQSDTTTAPVVRIFAQPMDLYVPTTANGITVHSHASSKVGDPIAGQVKLSRTGRPLYVRPVEQIEGDVDLSREENPKGLYAATRTVNAGPNDSIRIRKASGENTGQYVEVKGFRLHAERGWTFWRFNIEVELGMQQTRIAYRLNNGPAVGFWVPAKGQNMNVMFHSCNGFSLTVDAKEFSGPDPLWRDVMNRHQSDPFHVMIGGGDQIYNDAAMRDTELFKDWLQEKNRDVKYNAQFTPELVEELEIFYLERYAMWFSQGIFAMANSQIPMVNLWDDHDIIDGFGSYPHHFMSSPVFTGLGAVAFKYYMLFQHQSVVDETDKEEPSWLLGASRGPYINELSRSVFLSLGRSVAFLGLDCRTERMREEILSHESYQIIFDRCRRELVKGMTRHLIVLLGVPIAYPRLNFLENILTSRVMDPIKALGRTGILGGFVNKFDGGVELLDDLDDHWTAKHHKTERNWFVQELQELAAEYSVRITILGGDVHLAAVGQFFTAKKLNVPKDKDHRYMPNVISSAIVNTPPPSVMADVLNKRDKIHHLDHETDENMIPMFLSDVDGSARNNKRLLPRRNYCTIREFVPGGTPPPSPRLGPQSHDVENEDDNDETEQLSQQQPGIRRTMSLTNNPAINLVRRFSTTKRGKNPPVSINRSVSANNTVLRRTNSLGDPIPSGLQSHPPEFSHLATADGRPSFHRRPTDLSDKQIRKASTLKKANPNTGTDAVPDTGHINLEFGLDVSLNVEIDQHDPSGRTVPYRILVPALWYTGVADPNTVQRKPRKLGLLQRFTSGRRVRDDDDEYVDNHYDGTTSIRKESYPIENSGLSSVRPSTDQRHLSQYEEQDHYGSRDTSHAVWQRDIDSARGSPGTESMGSEHIAEARHVGRPNGMQQRGQRSLSPVSFVSGDDRELTPRPEVMAMRQKQKANKFFGITPDEDTLDGQQHQAVGGGGTRRHVSLREEPTTFVYDAPPRRRASWKIWQR